MKKLLKWEFRATSRQMIPLYLALGGMTDGVTLNSLTDAYRVFANGGVYTPAKYVKAIYDYNVARAALEKAMGES